MKNNERKEKAIEILKKEGLENLCFLGQGFEGVVFHDERWVYKVIIPFFVKGNKWNTIKHLSFFLEDDKRDYKSFYKIEELIETKDGYLIEKYPYEKSASVTAFSEKEVIDLLVECWQKKLIIQDCKKENFIRVNGELKLIDMDAVTYYSDSLFLNACARMFIYLYHKDNPNIKKLQRSAINNFDLPELEGFRNFVNSVFLNIVFSESKEFISCMSVHKKEDLVYEVYSTANILNLEELFYEKLKENLYLVDIQVTPPVLSKDNSFSCNSVFVGYKKIESCSEKVSLLIKTCAMDSETIEQNIKHIVKQLSTPKTFYEIVVSVDSKKEEFLRQYTENPNYEKVIQIVNQLKEEKIIDRYIIFNPHEAIGVNKRWFNIETEETHSVRNIPISSQLYAFEQCLGNYILQVDSDVIIGRKDLSHDYLSDMINEIKKNINVISVGFNIYNSESKAYFGFENGGYVPEVRMCLFNKERFFSIRPLPNSIDKDGRLTLSWYRSMEQKQKESTYCSIRGGNNRTFFIHPQNYRKTSPHTWLNILDRTEQLEIPDVQMNCFDAEGSFYDWCRPKRSEKLIVMSCFRNITSEKFLRFWVSLRNQSYKDFGLVLYDDFSDNGVSIFIEHIIKPYKNKITYIRARSFLPKLQCEYIIVHNICIDPN